MLIGIFYSPIVESSSLVSVLFREAISHPYISFFRLLVNGFSGTSKIKDVTDSSNEETFTYVNSSVNISVNGLPLNIKYSFQL